MVEFNKIHEGDCIELMKSFPDECVNTIITSPPYYGLRDYCDSNEKQIGMEATLESYISNLVNVFSEARRILKNDGTLWVNIGDCYNGSGKGVWKKRNNKNQKETYVPPADTKPSKIANLKPKDLVGVPWKLAFALQEDGWYLRQDIIWEKGNSKPESVKDRCVGSHEYLFLLSKSRKYYFDQESIKEPSVVDPSKKRSPRSVWTVNTKITKGIHTATFPPDLIRPCVLAGSPKDGVVFDPFMGSGTTALVAKEEGRKYLGTELNPEYIQYAEDRVNVVNNKNSIVSKELFTKK